MGYVYVDGIEYALYGNFPIKSEVSRAAWAGGYTHPGPPNHCGFFFLNDANLLSANLNFQGPNGNVTYIGLVYQ